MTSRIMTSREEKKSAGIIIYDRPHYIDHTAIVCDIMNMPLLCVGDREYEIAQKYYPGIDTRLEDYDHFNPEYLIANYDVIFSSDQWNKTSLRELYAPLEKKYHKRMRHVHCPHGYSDKAFYLKLCADDDITLVYGQNMLDMFKKCGVLENLETYVLTGNYRYTYFKKHQDFYRKVMHDEILSKFAKKQRLILYAPTWEDQEKSSTFFDAISFILDSLPDDTNIIVKLHPRYEDEANHYSIMGKYEKKENVLFLIDFSPIYALLDAADIYIGDVSSIGYDFLIFNKPMFFLNKTGRDSKTDPGLFLYRTGVEITPQEFGNIYQIIERNLPQDQKRFSTIRKELYEYTFGKEIPFPDIKKAIVKAYSNTSF